MTNDPSFRYDPELSAKLSEPSRVILTPYDATAIAAKINEFRNALGVLDGVGEKVTGLYAQSLLDYVSVR